MITKLYRSRTDSMIGGVCGGLGQYLGIDPTIVRLFFVLLALGNGIGVLIYLALWLIVPREGQAEEATMEETIRAGAGEIAERARALGDDLREAARSPNPQTSLFVGAALIVLGVVFLLQNLNLAWLRWLDFDVLWPVLLVVAGLALLLRRVKGE
ncbi:MAG: PspC domain-containing protein [Anaerolineales bacterium]|nr:MAG: PspC domain-containing protein [Anaerolineales bacterium]